MYIQNTPTALEQTAQIIGMPFYWLDLNHIFLGANDLTITTIGAASTKDVIGKTFYDLYPYDLAQEIALHHRGVISSGETLVVEETIKNVSTGAIQYYTATIWPLRDNNGEIIGTAGTSTDITGKKIADERLRQEKLLAHLMMMRRDFTSATLLF